MTTDHRQERGGSEQELAYGADAGCWAVYVTIYCYYYILSFCEQRQTAVLLVIDVCRWQRWHRGKIRHLRGCPLWFGGGCLLCLPFVSSAASVLFCLTVVPDIIWPGMYTYVFLGWSCVGRSFAISQVCRFVVSNCSVSNHLFCCAALPPLVYYGSCLAF